MHAREGEAWKERLARSNKEQDSEVSRAWASRDSRLFRFPFPLCTRGFFSPFPFSLSPPDSR